MAQIVVKLMDDGSRKDRASLPESVAGLAGAFAVDLRPMHPGVPDANLATYYTAECDDPAVAQSLTEKLLEDATVDAAYVKPQGEPPKTTGA